MGIGETSDGVPVIDLSPSFDDEKGASEVANRISYACETLGFLIVTGHGINQSIIDDVLTSSSRFFEQSLQDRISAMPPSPYVFRGYFPSEASALAASLDIDTPGDLCEVFCINRFDDREEAIRAGLKENLEAFFAPNIWPKDLPEFKSSWNSYYSAMEGLSEHLLSLMARALGLPKNWFEPFCDKHTTNLVANYYPPQVKKPLPNQLRRGAHTDYGSITVLYQSHSSGGLQIESPDGSWLDVPYIDKSFVINIGDLLSVWTNDRWVSTMHRVVNPPREEAGQSRQSLAFFHQPNFDAKISCISSCRSIDNPPKYADVKAGEWILAKLQKSVD